ncbi:hypothetical protein [Macrococcus equipercicus]|uniref:Uncharacterized protein n=1 Tax=Macrococcus equipercicus TaxID=69967 RepID=A0A9Q9BUJ1_9STAP|nr:hypothetical protein [Macrococcus equipercicus]UTH13307.1 hypothetical protein KFV11_08540 [Macrococcus equipercicus]
MKPYKKQHIIKHALEHYIKRPGASDEDLNQEKKVLEEVKADIQQMKEQYNIK